MDHLPPAPSGTIMAPISPTTARFIRLGPGGRWARHCFEERTIEFGYADEPHDLCAAGDWDGVRRHFLDLGRSESDASNATRELRDFYTLEGDCLWITIADGHLWWAFAEPEVRRLGPGEHGFAMRRAVGWHNYGMMGADLSTDRLSTRLTQVAGYQRTICQYRELESLLRIINGTDDPAMMKACAALEAMAVAGGALIARLHQNDFELFADLLLTSLGWRRVSQLGGIMADADLIVEQPATGERAFVQVKSRATQAVLDDYLERFRASGLKRMFFICHSPEGLLMAPKVENIHVWTGDELAHKAVAAGLVDWLMERAR